MAQFVPFEEGVEVLGGVVLSIVNSIDEVFESEMLSILEMHGITDPQPDTWYPLDSLLSALKYIADEIGPNTLFVIGKGIVQNAKFPEGIGNIKEALISLDEAYHMNHRGGDIGYYKVEKFDEDERTAVIECTNPYPHYFDKGILTALSRRYAPDVSNIEVEADPSRPNRLDGSDSDFFIVRW